MKDTIQKHVMVDIETMGNKSYSAIVSIGAVEFDIETGKTGREFYLNVSLQSCLDAGLKVNADTVMWWMKQSEEARRGITEGTKFGLGEALQQFSRWLDDDSILWGNSARFDLGLLNNAYEVEGILLPWAFNNERCVRTLVTFAPEIKANYVHQGVDHNALSDCYKQIGYCSKIWNTIFNPKSAKHPDGEWELKAHNYQIADTGDYDGHYEITNGKISILSEDDDDEALQQIVDAFNDAGCKFFQDDSIEFEKEILKKENKILNEQLRNLSEKK